MLRTALPSRPFNDVTLKLCHEFSLHSFLSNIQIMIATVKRHYMKRTLNYPMIAYMTLVHLSALIGLFHVSSCHKATLLWALSLWPIRSVDILCPNQNYLISRLTQLTFFLKCSRNNRGSASPMVA